MPYQVNMVSAAEEGFTEEQLERALTEAAARSPVPMRVQRSAEDALELRGPLGLLATLFAAGREPYDYLLVDFVDRRSEDQAPPIQVMAAVAEALQMTVLEIESQLEYTPHQWALARTRFAGPDPARQEESRRIALEREIEFYQRRGVPYTPEDLVLLRDALGAGAEEGTRQAARELQDRKRREEKEARTRARREAARTPRWWPFRKRDR